MEYIGEDLPEGFMYLLNNRDLKSLIELFSNNLTITIKLGGVSYAESLVAKSWNTLKKIADIHTYIEDNRLQFCITQYGIRSIYLKNKDILATQKDKIKEDILNKIQENIDAYKMQIPIIAYKYVYLVFDNDSSKQK